MQINRKAGETAPARAFSEHLETVGINLSYVLCIYVLCINMSYVSYIYICSLKAEIMRCSKDLKYQGNSKTEKEYLFILFKKLLNVDI